jgi:hypothetical protein
MSARLEAEIAPKPDSKEAMTTATGTKRLLELRCEIFDLERDEENLDLCGRAAGNRHLAPAEP